MKDNLSIYKTWAPDHVLWTEWVKPVLFAKAPHYRSGAVRVPKLDWVNVVNYSTAFILDLPGAQGVREGLALAELGYRPIPLYNGVEGPNTRSMIVDVTEIVSALVLGAGNLEDMSIRPDAPPAFLLDFNRMRGYGKEKGKYDNRWCVFPQDMPSAQYLAQKGIDRVVVRTTRIQNDLSHILHRYQKAGLEVYLCDERGMITQANVQRPSRFRSLLYRSQQTMGLTRNTAGGFGGHIPMPDQADGVRYYGRIG